MEAQLTRDLRKLCPKENSFESDENEHEEEETFTVFVTNDMPDIERMITDDVQLIREESHPTGSFDDNCAEHNIRSEGEKPSSPTCFSCTKKCELKHGHDIKKGSHLVYGRYMPFTKGNEKLDKIIKNLSDKFEMKQPFFYEHHAIVSEVLETSDRYAKIKIVEFQSLGSLTFRVIESQEPITIDLNTDTNIFYKDYNDLPYTADEIVERARSKVGEGIYEILNNNCEHVAVWCVSGKKESFQAQKAEDKYGRKILPWLGSVLGKIVRHLKPIDTVSIGSKTLKYVALSFPFLFVAAGFFLIEIIFNIMRFVELKHQLKDGLICQNCFNRKKVNLIAKLVCSFIASIGLCFVPLSGTHAIAVIAVGIAASIVLPNFVSVAYRKIKTIINPLYEVPKLIITNCNQIRQGDVINIPDDHDIIVKSVKKIQRYAPSGRINLHIVHFKCKGILADRTIENELFNLKLSEVEVFDFDPNDVYPDEEVVRLAKEKVGKSNFNSLWYRSSHMSKFCKVKNYFEKFWLSLTDVKTSKRQARRHEDVNPGDMINFNYYGLRHVGIVTEKLPTADVVQLEYVHVKDGEVCVDKNNFDLDRRMVRRLQFGVDNDNTLQNALEMRGEEVSIGPFKSARFVSKCLK